MQTTHEDEDLVTSKQLRAQDSDFRTLDEGKTPTGQTARPSLLPVLVQDRESPKPAFQSQMTITQKDQKTRNKTLNQQRPQMLIENKNHLFDSIAINGTNNGAVESLRPTLK